jgi:hypothetical protein
MFEDAMRSDESRRSNYRVPTLHRFGGMRELTAGGSGLDQEGTAMGNPNKRP